MVRTARALILLVLFVSFLTSCLPVITAAETSNPGAPLPQELDTPVPPEQTTPEPAITQAPQPTPTDGCLYAGGEVTRTYFRSGLMEYPYEVSIYLPPCYGSFTDVRYPVLYLIHGQNQDDTFWLSLGVKELADRRIANGAPPFLMVMPREIKNFDPVTETKFPDSIIQELIPWVEEKYMVCTTRDCRAVGGISRGGGWAIRLAMRNFDTFGSVGAHSMGLMEGDWWQAQKHLETRTPEEYPRIWIDQGEEDGLIVDTEFFVRILKSHGIPYEYHVNRGNHDVKYWKAHVDEYLDWYIQGWR